MTHSIPFQAINSAISVLSFCLLLVFVNYIYKNWKEGYVFLRPAIALITLWTGIFVLRFPIFIARTQYNAGDYSQEMPWTFLMAGSFIMVLAFLCTIRVFSPTKWKDINWISSLLLSILVTGASVLYVYAN